MVTIYDRVPNTEDMQVDNQHIYRNILIDVDSFNNYKHEEFISLI